jgi:hypothetical protein
VIPGRNSSGLEKINGVTTDRTSCVISKETGLIDRMRRDMDRQNPAWILHELYRVMHQQPLCGRTLNYEHIRKLVMSVVNFMDCSLPVSHIFHRKLMFNMETSCTIHKSDG